MRALRNPGTICSLQRLLKELKACHGRAEPCGPWPGLSQLLRPLSLSPLFSFPLCAVAVEPGPVRSMTPQWSPVSSKSPPGCHMAVDFGSLEEEKLTCHVLKAMHGEDPEAGYMH